MQTIRIGIIGDFNPILAHHVAIDASLTHAGEALAARVESKWLVTDGAHDYGDYHGLFCSSGSPYRSLEGCLAAIRHAREKQTPFLGTCAGFQHAVLEYARNVMGMRDAMHAEYDAAAPLLFVTPLSCSLVGKTLPVDLAAGSLAAKCYRQARAEESYYCTFGLNPAYREKLQAAGMRVSGWDDDGEPRIVELPGHPFFVGALFVPQMKSRAGAPHPLILEFCRASARRA